MTHVAMEMAIERVDFPIKMVIFHGYVKLPEGTFMNYPIFRALLGTTPQFSSH